MLHFRSRHHDFAVLHTFGRDQLAGNFVNLARCAAHDDHLQTVMGIQMDVQARIDGNAGAVLHVGKKVAQVVRAMVIQERDDAHDFFIALANFFLNQVIPYQVTDGFGTIFVAETFDASIESFQKIAFQRNPKTREMVHRTVF